MLTGHQRADFERLGVIRLTRIFSSGDAARMTDRVWEALVTEHGIRRDEPATWTIEQPTGFQTLTRSGAFDALAGVMLADAFDDLFGAGEWTRPKHWGVPLVKFPVDASRWDVPSTQWHLDFPARGRGRPLCAVRLLAFLDTVLPRAGGTLVLAGSHRLVERFVATGGDAGGHSRDVRHALMCSDPWLRRLWSREEREDRPARFMAEDVVVDGVAVSVLELTGEPGDAVLLHPWLFHAPAPNCGTSPRLVLSQSVVRAGHASAADVARAEVDFPV